MTKRFTALLSVVGAAMAAFALMASFAQAATPAPGYSQFAGCPTKAEKAEIEDCYTIKIKSGNFKIGSKNVPIENPITLDGGWGPAEKSYFSPKGGMTKAKQKVPGGVIGLTGLTWLAEVLGSSALTLYATTELAGTPGAPLNPPFQIPVKVHLENSTGVLGPNCYIGSTASPIVLNLITETTSPPPPNEPITGRQPELEASPTNENIILLKNGEFVDNSFSAPSASGCTLTLFGFIPISLNSLVNAQSGLPAAAGTNETRQVADTEVVNQEFVYP
ncbi:MAG TPA: hypothetical protein VHS74_19680 [Solirubrobacterales bacterium]|jgi:hypothetical protein|nr:hypothetical protein [Solirubrobacterales bacterium]